MKLDKDILEHKKSSSKKASKAYFDQTKSEIWEAIKKNETPVRSIRSNSVWYITGLSAAAAIAIIFTIWNFNTTLFTYKNLPQSAQSSIDSTDQNGLSSDIPDDYYANNYKLEAIEEVYYEDVQTQNETEDTATVYEDYLIEQNIDESMILDELL